MLANLTIKHWKGSGTVPLSSPWHGLESRFSLLTDSSLIAKVKFVGIKKTSLDDQTGFSRYQGQFRGKFRGLLSPIP